MNKHEQVIQNCNIIVDFQTDSLKICRSFKAHLYLAILSLSDGNHGRHTLIPHHVSVTFTHLKANNSSTSSIARQFGKLLMRYTT